MLKKFLVAIQAKSTNEISSQFLISLAFNLTVVSRNTYTVGEDEVANPKALRGLNEIGHMVLSRAINIANGAWRHEAEVFAEKIFALAIRYGCIFELENAISFASENFKID